MMLWRVILLIMVVLEVNKGHTLASRMYTENTLNSEWAWPTSQRHPHDSNNQGGYKPPSKTRALVKGWFLTSPGWPTHYFYCEIRHHVARRWIFSCHPGLTKKIRSMEIPRGPGVKKMRLRQRGYGFSMDTLSRFVLHWGAKLWHVNCVEIDSCLQIPIYSTSQEVTNFSGFPFTMLSAVGLIDFQHFFVDDQGYRVAGCRSGIWYNLAHQVFINASWIFIPEKSKLQGDFPGFHRWIWASG